MEKIRQIIRFILQESSLIFEAQKHPHFQKRKEERVDEIYDLIINDSFFHPEETKQEREKIKKEIIDLIKQKLREKINSIFSKQFKDGHIVGLALGSIKVAGDNRIESPVIVKTLEEDEGVMKNVEGRYFYIIVINNIMWTIVLNTETVQDKNGNIYYLPLDSTRLLNIVKNHISKKDAAIIRKGGLRLDYNQTYIDDSFNKEIIIFLHEKQKTNTTIPQQKISCKINKNAFKKIKEDKTFYSSDIIYDNKIHKKEKMFQNKTFGCGIITGVSENVGIVKGGNTIYKTMLKVLFEDGTERQIILS